MGTKLKEQWRLEKPFLCLAKASVRDLPMPDLACEALIEHRQNTMGTGRLFTTAKGTPFSARNILKYFQRELERLGVPKIPFHNPRHSRASYHLAAGTSPRFVQELRGHTTVAFTLRKYSHLLPGVAEEAAEKLNQTLAKNSVKQTRKKIGRSYRPILFARINSCARV